MSFEHHYLRGAFAAYSPRALVHEPPQLIPFRFNPEKLERHLNVGQAQGDGGMDLAQGRMGAGVETGGKRTADAASGALTESFSVEVRFDLHERHAALGVLPPELGIAPEIAALELLVQPYQEQAEADSRSGTTPRLKLPTVLFIWGRMRVLPVRITSLQINETVFNAQLNPTRAEATVGLEVVSGLDADAPVVKAALEFTRAKRQALGRLFHAATVAQGSSILPL